MGKAHTRLTASLSIGIVLIAAQGWLGHAPSRPKSVGQVSVTDTYGPYLPRAYAKRVYLAEGGAPKNFRCLVILWYEESRWNYRSVNPRGGATGIPQAQPASKMRWAGEDYLTNAYTQIRWGLHYIKIRYANNPCYALAHKHKKGWY